MRVIVQRVSEAAVSVGGTLSGRIGPGLLVLAGFEDDDRDGDLDWMAQKLLRLRIFADDAGVMNRSVAETGGEILAVSQFTLYASTKKGPLLNFEWVTVHEDGSPRPGVKGGRSPAQRTLDAWNRAIRWSMAGCGAVTHPAIETRAVFG
jgi:D-Tyr-tRNAtyr deacylase